MSSTPTSREDGAARPRLVAAIILLALLLFAMRIPALLTPVPKIDEALYAASAASSVAAGDPLPYRASWQDKGPVQMWLYMLVFWLFGNYNMLALHLFATLLVGLGAIPVWQVASAASSPRGGLWAALLYMVSMQTGNAIPFNSEAPAAIATAFALAMLIRIRLPETRRQWLLVFVAGVLGGIAFLTRQNYLLLVPVLPVCVWILVGHRGGSWREVFGLSALSLAGFASSILFVMALFAAGGALDTFIFCFWTVNTIYVGATVIYLTRILGIPNETMRMFLRTSQTAVTAGFAGIVLLVASAARGTLFTGSRRPVAALAGLFAIGFTLGGIPGLRFFSHYFVMAIPFWCMIGGATIAIVLDRLQLPAFTTAARLAIVLSLALDLSGTPFFETVLDTLRWGRYGGLRDRSLMEGGLGINVEAQKIVNRINRNKKPEDTLFVWGFAPFFYLQSELVPATRIVNGCYLSGLVPWENVSPDIDTTRWIVPGAWDANMQDLERTRPVFIVDASRHQLFASGKYPISKFPPLQQFIEGGYVRTDHSASYDLWIRKDRVPEQPASAGDEEAMQGMGETGGTGAGGAGRTPGAGEVPDIEGEGGPARPPEL